MRMVGHDDNRAFFWNTIQLGLGRSQLDTHYVQSRPPEPLSSRRRIFLKLADQAQDRQFTSKRFDNANQRGLKRILKGRGIRKATPIILVEARLLRLHIS